MAVFSAQFEEFGQCSLLPNWWGRCAEFGEGDGEKAMARAGGSGEEERTVTSRSLSSGNAKNLESEKRGKRHELGTKT